MSILRYEDSFVAVGKALRTYGNQGEIRCWIEPAVEAILKPGDFLWVDQNGLKVPLMVRSMARSGKRNLIGFVDIVTEQQADAIQGCKLLIRERDLSHTGYELFADDVAHDFAGFAIVDDTSGLSGIIARVVEFPGQEMAFARLDGREDEVMIPLADDLIVDIRLDQRTIRFKLPEGMFEMDD